VKGGKARPSRSIKKISGKLPEIIQEAVAKMHFATAPCYLWAFFEFLTFSRSSRPIHSSVKPHVQQI
jgi:hypothetical protein